MSRPRVFIVNETVRRNRSSGDFERNRDFTDAERYGDLVHLTPPGTPPGDLSRFAAGMARTLADFKEDDFIIPIGHPALIGWATALAARASGGRVTMLVWHEQSATYFPCAATLWTEKGKEPEKMT